MSPTSIAAAAERKFVKICAANLLHLGDYQATRRSAAPAGEAHDVSGVYREVIPNEKLVYSWAWKSTPERESLVTIELTAAAGGTELTLKHDQFFDEAARDRHEHGWTGCLARLDRYLGK